MHDSSGVCRFLTFLCLPILKSQFNCNALKQHVLTTNNLFQKYIAANRSGKQTGYTRNQEQPEDEVYRLTQIESFHSIIPHHNI
jgi:hypothetical protein